MRPLQVCVVVLFHVWLGYGGVKRLQQSLAHILIKTSCEPIVCLVSTSGISCLLCLSGWARGVGLYSRLSTSKWTQLLCQIFAPRASYQNSTGARALISLLEICPGREKLEPGSFVTEVLPLHRLPRYEPLSRLGDP